MCRGRRNQGLGRLLAAWVAAQGADIQEPAAPAAAEVQRSTQPRRRTDEGRKKRGSPHARRRRRQLQQQLPRGPVAAATARRQGRHVRRLPPAGPRPRRDAGIVGEAEEAGGAAPVREAAGGLQGRVQPARPPARLPQEAEGPGGGQAEAAHAPAEQPAAGQQPEGRLHGRRQRRNAPVHGRRQPAGAEPAAGGFPADEPRRANVQPQLLMMMCV